MAEPSTTPSSESHPSKKIKAIKTEVYSRIVGYYRPVDSWNAGKKEEFRQRTNHSLPDDL